jgi:hypothetical protein
LLGLGPSDVVYDTPKALKALAQACLRHRLAASDDPRCADFRRLIEEAVRPDVPRYSADLDTHTTHCPYCAAAIADLTALRDTPGQALAEGLLPWRGTAYVRDTAATPPGPKSSPVHSGWPGWPPRRRYLLASAALGVALAPLLVFLLAPSDDPHGQPVAATPTPPPVTVTATVSVSPSPSPSPSRTAKSPSPSPTRTSHRPVTPSPSPARPKPSPKPPQAPATHAPNGTYAQIVNNATGLCLDVRDGWFDNGTDVITAPCSGSDTQLWRVDAEREVVQSYADEDYCLDSRGSTDRGVGIWTCSSVYGGNGRNLRFSVQDDGLIIPHIDWDTAVTATGGDSVWLDYADGNASKWHAGRSG